MPMPSPPSTAPRKFFLLILRFSSKNACSSFCSVPVQTFLDAHRKRDGTSHGLVYSQNSRYPEQGLVARRSFVLARNAVCKAIVQKIRTFCALVVIGVLRCLMSVIVQYQQLWSFSEPDAIHYLTKCSQLSFCRIFCLVIAHEWSTPCNFYKMMDFFTCIK